MSRFLEELDIFLHSHQKAKDPTNQWSEEIDYCRLPKCGRIQAVVRWDLLKKAKIYLKFKALIKLEFLEVLDISLNKFFERVDLFQSKCLKQVMV